jgi:hypothetical protein
MLANLVFVTRPASEIGDPDDAAQWVGLPEMGDGRDVFKLIVHFESDAERRAFIERTGIGLTHAGERYTWTARYPPREAEDRRSLRYEGTRS